MSLLQQLPLVVQRAIAADADCEFVSQFSLSRVRGDSTVPPAAPEPEVLSVSSVVASSRNETAPNDESRWTLIYDIMKVEQQRVLFETAHLRRIGQSFQTSVGVNISELLDTTLKQSLHQYVEGSLSLDAPPQNVKFLAWWPAGDDNAATDDATRDIDFVVFLVKSFFPPPEWYVAGAKMALLYNAHRENPNAKVVQSGLRARAKALQEQAGVFEVLLVHGEQDDFLIPEGSRSNYLLVKDPPTSTADDDEVKASRVLCSSEQDILIGITLKAAQRAAVRAGLGEIKHQRLTLKDLCAAQSVVMLGTSVGVLPINEVLLYVDEKGQRDFEAAAAACGIALSSLKRLRVSASSPPTASLVLEVQNTFEDVLMKAFREETLA